MSPLYCAARKVKTIGDLEALTVRPETLTYGSLQECDYQRYAEVDDPAMRAACVEVNSVDRLASVLSYRLFLL